VGWASQEQAFRPVPQHIKFIVGWAGVLARQRLIDNGASISFETEISTRELLGLFHKKNISDAVERAKLHQIGKLLRKAGAAKLSQRASPLFRKLSIALR
jgi:hypothetical protein